MLRKYQDLLRLFSGSLNILDTDYMLEGSRGHDTYLYVETVIYGIVAMMFFN